MSSYNMIHVAEKLDITIIFSCEIGQPSFSWFWESSPKWTVLRDKALILLTGPLSKS